MTGAPLGKSDTSFNTSEQSASKKVWSQLDTRHPDIPSLHAGGRWLLLSALLQTLLSAYRCGGTAVPVCFWPKSRMSGRAPGAWLGAAMMME